MALIRALKIKITKLSLPSSKRTQETNKLLNEIMLPFLKGSTE